ncbi:hypothetical protein AB4Z52_07050 [Rhizobium sp. 2YAF20]|uniref:hypothetical protein n=1 Tax=Rhizobium sp. 2YAF20 TaxID=3233027 RepID=UPI003F990344
MTTHRSIGNAERSLLPRGLIARRPVPGSQRRPYYDRWNFQVGDTVTIGPMTGVIVERRRTGLGSQVFYVAVLGESYGRPLRMMMPEALTRGPAPITAAQDLEAKSIVAANEEWLPPRMTRAQRAACMRGHTPLI